VWLEFLESHPLVKRFSTKLSFGPEPALLLEQVLLELTVVTPFVAPVLAPRANPISLDFG